MAEENTYNPVINSDIYNDFGGLVGSQDAAALLNKWSISKIEFTNVYDNFVTNNTVLYRIGHIAIFSIDVVLFPTDYGTRVLLYRIPIVPLHNVYDHRNIGGNPCNLSILTTGEVYLQQIGTTPLNMPFNFYSANIPFVINDGTVVISE